MNVKKGKKELDFFRLFERFISDSGRGKRLQPNGKKLSEGTIRNYGYTQKLLEDFCGKKKFVLRICKERHLNQREAEREKNYWKKFYKKFTDYLYSDCGCFDNYVGQNIKIIKTFFGYLNKDLALGVGQFHRQFYVRKEEVAIYPLLPEELNYLIYNREFENTLTPRFCQAKDVFVFGCTVALRVSDLLALKKTNVRTVNGQHYMAVRSQKTSTDTLVKLPDYAVDILAKYKKLKKGLLPSFNKSNLNEYIKLLLEKAGLTQPVSVCRERRGTAVEVKRMEGAVKSASFRFCDVASTHTMRRTAITTMLCLGMPEQLVRRISGHAPHSKEFYRYISWAQTYMDQESEKMFEKLKGKELKGDRS